MKTRILTLVPLVLASLLGGCAVYSPPPVASGPVIYRDAPVYTQPAPVYAQPAPVYVQPAPVYVRPAPVYVEPPVSFRFNFGYRGGRGWGGHHHRW
ncbi:PXPV repeat-containing protein [Noviherbaspirillum humi]|uniref:PXPV repeat-containing protein n=1 Tax=Noviherbaspirillum humi TaxID=1688639 RepID=A0A239L5V0_9BURK|nr:hypothetical protein [Noviherbaspirillum humi]SNT25193.1 PXPV repeat-containing protein [Noviherbaspirillum humi]